MQVSAWNNGKHKASGAGYGFHVRVKDRNYFKGLSTIVLLLEGQGVCTANISKSFWKDVRPCTEIRKKEIGIWLRNNKKAPWDKYKPPKMIMEQITGNKFKVKFSKEF
jgi:hypothetical protein